MAEDQPSSSGGGSTVGPWVPGYPASSPSRPRVWPAMVVGVVGVVLGAAGLVVALTRPTPEPVAKAPTYTPAEIAAAHQKLCDTYKLEASAVKIGTNGDNPELAGISTVNGAVMLEYIANTTPAIPSDDRAAALVLAEAYSHAQATAPSIPQREDPAWQSIIADVNAKDTTMRRVCGGG
jgi:hypothetical protein